MTLFAPFSAFSALVRQTIVMNLSDLMESAPRRKRLSSQGDRAGASGAVLLAKIFMAKA